MTIIINKCLIINLSSKNRHHGFFLQLAQEKEMLAKMKHGVVNKQRNVNHRVCSKYVPGAIILVILTVPRYSARSKGQSCLPRLCAETIKPTSHPSAPSPRRQPVLPLPLVTPFTLKETPVTNPKWGGTRDHSECRIHYNDQHLLPMV